jgi:sigma-B regulation protein RsbU (phosphoserine phosphatase)
MEVTMSSPVLAASVDNLPISAPSRRGSEDWQTRLALIVEMMREMSQQTEPMAMVRAYGARVDQMRPRDGFLSLSRRDLDNHRYRITRSSRWTTQINPWKEKERLPLFQGGLLAELIYGDEPAILDDFQVAADDPAYEYLAGFRSLMAIPNFDQGLALNMTISLSKEPHGFPRDEFPELVWVSNLFGRATYNLVLSDKLREAYAAVDQELKVVADIQRALLPKTLPHIPTMDLAVHYQTARRAGGDYYDFFRLNDGKWGILIADASGHSTPAAVIMAITHSLAHAYAGPPAPASKLFDFINAHLTARYTGGLGSFVTAFYGVYDPATRILNYASAGHNPPRLKRCAEGAMSSLDGVGNLPLGISGDVVYEQSSRQLIPGDQIVFFTDGIIEAQNRTGEMFGPERLDSVLADCRNDAADLIQAVLNSVEDFTGGQPPSDDQTLLVAKIS